MNVKKIRKKYILIISCILLLRPIDIWGSGSYIRSNLEYFVEKGDISEVLELLDREVDSKTLNRALIVAVENDKSRIVNILLKHGADVTIRDKYNWTLLQKAVWSNDYNVMKVLLKHGADINDISKGSSPFAKAIERGYEDIMELLLEHGARFDLEAGNERISLHIAIESGYIGIVKKLISKNQRVDIKDFKGYSALHYACKYGKYKIAKLLIEKGSDVNILSNDRSSPLKIALLNTNKRIIDLLLQKGANVNLTDNKNQTALHFVDNIFTAKKIIKYGGNLNVKNSKNQTPLFLAIKNNNLKLAHYYIQNNASLADDQALLQIAIESKEFEMLKFLLEQRLDTNTTNFSKGYTPLHLACYFGIDIKYIKLLIEHGAKLDIKTEDGLTPLAVAIKSNHANSIKIIEYLLEIGANPNSFCSNEGSALHLAVLDKPEILDILFKFGADVNLKNIDGNTALHLVLSDKIFSNVNSLIHTESSVTLLLKNSADISAKNKNNQTPLLVFVSDKYFTHRIRYNIIIEELLKSGASIYKTDKAGKSTLNYLAEKKLFNLIDLLRNYKK